VKIFMSIYIYRVDAGSLALLDPTVEVKVTHEFYVKTKGPTPPPPGNTHTHGQNETVQLTTILVT